KKTPPTDDARTPRRRGNAVTDYLDASEPLERKGFGEGRQAELSGAPLAGSISDWAEQIAREAENAVSSSASGPLLPDREDKASPSTSARRREGGPRSETIEAE